MTFNLSTFFISIISFGILYWLLSKYTFGPLLGIMEKRQQHIQDQIDTANNNRTQSEQLIEEQTQALQAARQEAYEIIDRARSAAGRQADEFLAQAKAEASRIRDEALRDIESEKQKAVAALRAQVSSLAVLIASKIIEKQVDEKSQKELIEQYLKEVGG